MSVATRNVTPVTAHEGEVEDHRSGHYLESAIAVQHAENERAVDEPVATLQHQTPKELKMST